MLNPKSDCIWSQEIWFYTENIKNNYVFITCILPISRIYPIRYCTAVASAMQMCKTQTRLTDYSAWHIYCLMTCIMFTTCNSAFFELMFMTVVR